MTEATVLIEKFALVHVNVPLHIKFDSNEHYVCML